MAEKRPTALVLPAPTFVTVPGQEALQTALRDDLHEVLSMMQLRVRDGAELEKHLGAIEAPLLLTFASVPALPAMAIEGALDALSDVDAIVGPCADGGLYLLGLAEALEPEAAAELARLLAQAECLPGVTELLAGLELECALLPPWFRMAGMADLSFARSLASLSLLSEAGEEDFLADRLRLWLEKHTDTA